MAYIPHNWQTGETITEELLDNIDGALRRASSGIQAQYLGTQAIGAATEFLGYLDSLRYYQGDGFTLGTNEIICNYAGVVAVSASIFCASGFTAGDQVLLTIGKNSDTVIKTSHIMAGTGKEAIVSPTVLVSVVAGDVLKLKIHNVTGARGLVGSSAVSYANGLMAHYLA